MTIWCFKFLQIFATRNEFEQASFWSVAASICGRVYSSIGKSSSIDNKKFWSKFHSIVVLLCVLQFATSNTRAFWHENLIFVVFFQIDQMLKPESQLWPTQRRFLRESLALIERYKAAMKDLSDHGRALFAQMRKQTARCVFFRVFFWLPMALTCVFAVCGRVQARPRWRRWSPCCALCTLTRRILAVACAWSLLTASRSITSWMWAFLLIL